VGPDDLDELADEALGRVCHESDPATRPAHAEELARRLLLVRREHGPEDRAHDVEVGVGDGQPLGVAFDEGHFDALGHGPPAGPLEQRGDVVDADDRAAASGRGQRGVAAPGRDIEDPLGGMDVERLDEELRHDQDLGPGHVVVAARPGGLLALFDRSEVGRDRE
jgi:hypothetical protein